MSEAVYEPESLTEDIELASAMVRFTQREERKTLHLRVSVKVRLAAALATVNEPVAHVTLAQRFGQNIGKPLRELEREGRIKHRVLSQRGHGKRREYLPVSVEWPADTGLPDSRPKPKVLSERQRNACRASAEAFQEEFRPWPFYDVKFLPYIKYMDAKMQRRYRRAAEFYGDKVPS